MSSIRSFFSTFYGFCFLTLCFAAMPWQLAAQELMFRHYGTAEGLPSSESYFVIQDSQGYMWFSTDRGLARFDGYNFATYTSADSLPDNTVFGLYEDHRRRIWVATYTSRTGYMYESRPHVYAYNDKVRSLVHSGILSGLYCDNKDRLWVGHVQSFRDDWQVHYIDTLGQIHAPPLGHEPDCIDIYIATPGNCLVSGSVSSARARIISLRSDKVLFHLPLKSSAPGDAFSYTEKDGTLWVCFDGQLWSFAGNKLVKHIEYTGKLLNFMVDEQKNLWLGFLGKGLLLYQASKGYRDPITLLDNLSVSGMCLDREKGKWFTTLENGVFYLPPGLCFSYSLKSGLSSSKVLQLNYFNGDLITVQSDLNASIKRKNEQSFKALNPPGSQVISIRKGVADTFYYNSSSSPVRFLEPGVFIDVHMQKIHVGAQRVWSFLGSEITCYNSKGDLKKTWSVPQIGRLTCVFEKDAEHDVLVGTVEGLYELKKGKIKDLRLLNNLLQTRISDLVRLNDSVLVIATMGQGLLLVRESDLSDIAHYTPGQGLPSAMCTVLLRQNDSVMWLGTNKGLCRIIHAASPGRAKLQVFNRHNGLASDEITDLCFGDGQLWVATQHGVSVIQNPLATETLKQPPLKIEKVLVNGNAIHPSAENNFSYRQNNIAVSFIGLNYQYPGELSYRYRLVGADSAWKITSNCSILFSALMPGSYVFQLQALGPNGHVFADMQSLQFTILSPYWRSWWFMLLMLLMLAAGVYAFVVYRIGAVKKQAQIKHTLESYRDKAMRAQMNPHFIYNAMNAIQNYIAKNDIVSSTDFLSRFARLMRLTFQNSFAGLVLLEKDLEALVLYTGMESIRFPDKFSFQFDMAADVKPDALQVPPLLVQPFVENAILHAFSGKEKGGMIRLQIRRLSDKIYFAIRDNGIGRNAASQYLKKKLKYKLAEERKESGITVTVARIRQVWGERYTGEHFKITDLFDDKDQPAGTLVEFYLPLHYDQSTFS